MSDIVNETIRASAPSAATHLNLVDGPMDRPTESHGQGQPVVARFRVSWWIIRDKQRRDLIDSKGSPRQVTRPTGAIQDTFPGATDTAARAEDVFAAVPRNHGAPQVTQVTGEGVFCALTNVNRAVWGKLPASLSIRI